MRVAHFVDELFRDRSDVDPASRPGMLDEIERAIAPRLDNRVADVRHVRDRAPVAQAVSPAALRSALDDVARDGARGDLIPGVARPAEGMHQRSEGQSRIGDAAGDHDVRAALQRKGNGRSAEVCVGGQNAVAYVLQRTAGVEILEIVPAGEQPVQAAEQVVSRHNADGELPAESELARDVGHGIRAGARIHAAGVRRYLDAARDHRGENAFHLGDEVRRVAAFGIARFLFLQDRHRDFGQIVHHQVIDRTAGHLPVRRLQPIAPKTLPARHPHRLWTCGHRRPPAP